LNKVLIMNFGLMTYCKSVINVNGRPKDKDK